MPTTAKRDIIAIGGSAGSGAVLKALVGRLPADLPASIFVSTHIPAHTPSLLSEILSSRAALPVSQAIDGQPIERGHVYVAAPDRHLLLVDGAIRLGEGPRENMVRPAIDPLFRSAALAFGPRAVGVVLTGMLNDGASGLHAIKSCGGTAVVESPTDAEVEQMPVAALEATTVDHVVPAADLSDLLVAIAGSDAGPAQAPTEELRLEVQIAAGTRLGSGNLLRIASPSPLSCPDCHGVLSEMQDASPLRYRCQIGHAYTAEVLDSLLISLAEDVHDRAIALLLAGLGSDGTAGVTATKKFGGLSIAELTEKGDPTGQEGAGAFSVADLRVPADEIAAQIERYARSLSTHGDEDSADETPEEIEGYLTQITTVLRNVTSNDFYGYKRGTFIRRVQRRMQVMQVETVQSYVAKLRGNREEVQHLFRIC